MRKLDPEWDWCVDGERSVLEPFNTKRYPMILDGDGDKVLDWEFSAADDPWEQATLVSQAPRMLVLLKEAQRGRPERGWKEWMQEAQETVRRATRKFHVAMKEQDDE